MAAVRLLVIDGDSVDAVMFDDGLVYVRAPPGVAFAYVRAQAFEQDRGLQLFTEAIDGAAPCGEAGRTAAVLTDAGQWLTRPMACIEARPLDAWVDTMVEESTAWGNEVDMAWLDDVRAVMRDPQSNHARLGAAAASGCPEPAPGSHVAVLVQSPGFAGTHVHFVAFSDGTVYYSKHASFWFVRLTAAELDALIDALDPRALRASDRPRCDVVLDAGDPTLYVRWDRGAVGRTIPREFCSAEGKTDAIVAAGDLIHAFDHERARPWGDARRAVWYGHVKRYF